MEGALLGLDEESVLQEALDDLTDVLDVFLNIPGVHQDVIKVDEDIREVLEDILDHPLKGLGAVLHPHRQSSELKEAPWSCDAAFMPVPLVNDYLMKSLGHINFTEDLGPSNVLSEGAKIRERKEIQDSLSVEYFEVAYRAK